MLLELHISDFAIIDQLVVPFEPGFNVLTGETGAGKSIIIDALGLLRGEKGDPSMVRAGNARARVEGVFSLAHSPDVLPILQRYDLSSEGDEQVILTREISAESGRSMARINRRAVNTATLREVGTCLLDIHGQHEGLAIFQTRTHLDMLDRYGGLQPLRAQVAGHVERLRVLRDELADLRTNESRRQERITELLLLVEDVEQTSPRPDEEQELLHERSLVQNAVRITELAAATYATLYEGTEHEAYPIRPVAELLGTVAGDLSELARLDPGVQALAEQATDLHYQLEDLAAGVRAYRDGLDFDPRRLDEIEERLTLLRSLQRKYGLDIAAMLARAEQATEELARLEHSSEHIAGLEAQEQGLLTELGMLARDLSQHRRAVGENLARLIEAAMGDLAMPSVRFAVRIAQQPDPQGVPVYDSDTPPESAERPAPARYACDKTGIDQLEFLLAPNPGEPLKPLVRIASGGESARLLLALKSILSRVDSIPTMVFDEIDVGVGGRAGQVVGQKLWAITDAHQVLCISHLPQVAAFADAHFAISKETVEGPQNGTLRTRTNLRSLSLEQRVDELAAMLDGLPLSEHSRASAREMTERAAAFKQHSRAADPPPTTPPTHAPAC